MQTNILIHLPDCDVVALDEDDARALHKYHMHHAATARSDADYAYHSKTANAIYSALRDAHDRTETQA